MVDNDNFQLQSDNQRENYRITGKPYRKYKIFSGTGDPSYYKEGFCILSGKGKKRE